VAPRNAHTAGRRDSSDDADNTEFCDQHQDSRYLSTSFAKTSARNDREQAADIPRARLSCMALEYDDGYGDALRAHLRKTVGRQARRRNA
jgi:hypothetical protein